MFFFLFLFIVLIGNVVVVVVNTRSGTHTQYETVSRHEVIIMQCNLMFRIVDGVGETQIVNHDECSKELDCQLIVCFFCFV